MDKIKFAVIGFGHIGRRHATIIHEFPNAELVAIVDVDAALTKHELFIPGIPFFNSIDELIASNIPCDVFSICTPNGLHAPYTSKALDNGKHVVVEKPMGLTRYECENMIFKALQKSKQVFVVKQNRYSPPVAWLKKIVDDGIIGDTLHVQLDCYWNRDDRYYRAKAPGVPEGWKGTKDLDGGVLFTQFSHFIDIMHWVFGDIKNIQARTQNFAHQHSTQFADSGNAIFEFIEGGTGVLNFSTAVWDKNLESSITVIGSKGSVKIGGQYMNEVTYCHIENYEMPTLAATNPPNDYGPFTGSAANHHYVIENVVQTLNGHDTITANMLEGMKVVDIIERIYAAADLK
jgi:predicted dehydrogenase